MSILKTKNIWLILSGILCVSSILALISWGLKPSIDFTGGTLMEIEFTDERPAKSLIEENLAQSQIETNINIKETGEKGYIFRMKTLTEEEHEKFSQKLKENYKFEEKRFDSIGPMIGQELKQKAIWSIILVIFAIVLYIAWAFRKVSKPVNSWKYGLIAIIALLHDILITVGIFAVLGHFQNVEVGLPFVAALLTILGYSVNDTIVVFDRIRENLIKTSHNEVFFQIVDKSITQTITRSINTAFTTLLVLFAVYFFGGHTIKDFILALIIGITAGTYSSIFIASPLLVFAEKIRIKK